MRKPRDIDAELKALADKAKGLKAKRILQLGELVILTGADALDLETLAGALLAAVKGAKTPETKEAWRHEGAGFFLSRRRKSGAGDKNKADGDRDRSEASGSSDAPR